MTRPLMCELMAFSATVDRETIQDCQKFIHRRGASEGPDASLKVYPASETEHTNLQAAMKQTLYYNVRKLHMTLSPRFRQQDSSIIYQRLVELLMKIHQDQVQHEAEAAEHLEAEGGEAAEVAAEVAAAKQGHDRQSVAFLENQGDCMRARLALERSTISTSTRCGVPRKFRDWSQRQFSCSGFDEVGARVYVLLVWSHHRLWRPSAVAASSSVASVCRCRRRCLPFRCRLDTAVVALAWCLVVVVVVVVDAPTINEQLRKEVQEAPAAWPDFVQQIDTEHSAAPNKQQFVDERKETLKVCVCLSVCVCGGCMCVCVRHES